jgi:hypothetical protein
MKKQKQVRKLIPAVLVQPGVWQCCLPLLAAAVGWGLFQPEALRAVPVTSPPRVLILDETVDGGINSQEAQAAQLAIPGCAVDVVSAVNWAGIPATGTGGPTGYGFDSYRAIILGDPICTGPTTNGMGTSTAGYLAALTVLNGTKTTWTPVVTGNVILEGVDNAFHSSSLVGADKTLKRGIGFAVNDPTRTGLYYALSCYYDYTAPATNATLVPHLTGFGTFMVRNYPNTCFNDTHIVATHPVFTAAPPLTDAELSNWSCSTHEGFDVWPPNFVVLAIALTNGTYTATDGSNGVPYILVRGEGVKVISSIDLDPPHATNNVGTTHTVCATLGTNVFPYVGVPVTFTISSGPNAVTNYTTLTDSNGVACFTYAGMGGPGMDYITASYMTTNDVHVSSGTVTKLWENTCVAIGCENLECLADGTWTYTFCVTNLTTGPMLSLTLQNPPGGITFTPSTIALSPLLNVGQSTNVTVTIGSTAGPTNFCFQLAAASEGAGLPPCAVPRCLTLPGCCNRVVTNQLTYVSTSGSTSTYSYQITIQNVTGNPLKWVAFGADQSCVSFNPPMVNLTLPAYGGPSLLYPSQTRTLTVQVQKTAPCPGTNTFYLATLTTNLTACCSTKVTLPKPKCVYLDSPYDGSVLLTNTAILLRAKPTPLPIGPCPFGYVMFYQDATLVALADHEPYEATVTPTAPGIYSFTAVALLSNGELETSDPAEVTVLIPGAPHGQDDHSQKGGSLSAGVTGDKLLLNVATEPGHSYTVEYRTNLATGQWTALTNLTGDGSIKVIADPITNDASRFYRSVFQP